MKIRAIAILIIIAFCWNVEAYKKACFQTHVRYPKAFKGQLIKQPSGEKNQLLRYHSKEKLDNHWKEIGIVFVAEENMPVWFNLGPEGANSIPFYYDDIRVNDVPIPQDVEWRLAQPCEGKGRQSAFVPLADSPSGKPCLRLYHSFGAGLELPIKKGRVEITMKARAGSPMETFIVLLLDIRGNIDINARIKESVNTRDALNKLAGDLNQFIEVLGEDWGMKIDLIPQDIVSLHGIVEKLDELVVVCEREVVKHLNSPDLPLQNKLVIHQQIRDLLIQALMASEKVKSRLLLDFMFVK